MGGEGGEGRGGEEWGSRIILRRALIKCTHACVIYDCS